MYQSNYIIVRLIGISIRPIDLNISTLQNILDVLSKVHYNDISNSLLENYVKWYQCFILLI